MRDGVVLKLLQKPPICKLSAINKSRWRCCCCFWRRAGRIALHFRGPPERVGNRPATAFRRDRRVAGEGEGQVQALAGRDYRAGEGGGFLKKRAGEPRRRRKCRQE